MRSAIVARVGFVVVAVGFAACSGSPSGGDGGPMFSCGGTTCLADTQACIAAASCQAVNSDGTCSSGMHLIVPAACVSNNPSYYCADLMPACATPTVVCVCAGQGGDQQAYTCTTASGTSDQIQGCS